MLLAGAGPELALRSSSCCVDPSSTGSLPVSASYRVTPTAYKSAFGTITLTVCLLRRGIRRCADEYAIERAARAALGDVTDKAEIDDDDATLWGDKHVAGFQIPVHLAGCVNGSDAAHQLDQGRAQLRDVTRRASALTDVRQKIVARLDEVHHHEPAERVRSQAVQAHQILVHRLGQGSKLVLEPIERLRMPLDEQLDRDSQSGTLLVDCLVHGAGCTVPEKTLDPIAARETGRWFDHQLGLRARLTLVAEERRGVRSGGAGIASQG